MRHRRIFNPITDPAAPRRVAFEKQIALAHRLFEQGEYVQAGELFEHLAGIAAARGGPHAPRFYFQAGRAWLRAGQTERALALLEQGRSLCSPSLAARLSPRLEAELRALGLENQADQIAAWRPGNTATTAPIQSSRLSLPLKCPACGAPVHPDEVEWLDERTAECGFCGSALRAEQGD